MSERRESPAVTRALGGFWVIGTAVVVIALAFVIVLAHRPSNPVEREGLASPALVHEVTSIPDTVFAAVGTGTALNAPEPISAPALKIGSKPELLYIGAEYCPYCATERWPMVVALSRFGTFTRLRTTHSSSIDTFPNTSTFSFHHATYRSPYLAFTSVELTTNQPQGTGYKKLEKLTDAQRTIFSEFTQPPYAVSAGTIPFLDFGGRFLVTAVSYDPSLLQSKHAIDIARDLHDPSTAVSKGAIGVANLFTATICQLTRDQPADVCDTGVIARIERSMRG